MSAPAFKGGQGRSSQSVRADGVQVMFTLLLFVLFVVFAVSRGCSS